MSKAPRIRIYSKAPAPWMDLRNVTLSDGRGLAAPRHVVRSNVEGGFIVRLPGWPSKFFVDSRYGGAEGSLRAATAYLRRNYLKPVPGEDRPTRSQQGIVAGVRYAQSGPTMYVVAQHPSGKITRRFRLGRLDEGWSSATEVDAVRKARALRRTWLRERELPPGEPRQ